MEKKVKDFSDRLDKIFEDEHPTKAQIIDAFIKANQKAQEETEGAQERIGTIGYLKQLPKKELSFDIDKAFSTKEETKPVCKACFYAGSLTCEH